VDLLLGAAVTALRAPESEAMPDLESGIARLRAKLEPLVRQIAGKRASTCVYLVESWWYGTYGLVAAYDTLEEARRHAQHPETVKQYGRQLTIREIGVRSRLQFGRVAERVCAGEAPDTIAPQPPEESPCPTPPPSSSTTSTPSG
jgi:hypothetical protein